MCMIGTPSLRPRFDSSYAYLLLGLDDKLAMYMRFFYARYVYDTLGTTICMCAYSRCCINHIALFFVYRALAHVVLVVQVMINMLRMFDVWSKAS